MSERHDKFCSMHPDMHKDVQHYFPGFDYRHVIGDATVLLDYRNPNNMVGHHMRAFTCWWAIEKCGPLDLGLDFGSHRGLTPLTMHVDKWYTNQGDHPIYGGKIATDVIADISTDDGLSRFCPRTYPCIISCHSLEHMPGPDSAVVELLCRWHNLLRQGGALVLVVPDHQHVDVWASDRDHKSAWGHDDFRPRVLDPFLQRTGANLKEYDTLKNNFVFNAVIERTQP